MEFQFLFGCQDEISANLGERGTSSVSETMSPVSPYEPAICAEISRLPKFRS